MPNIFWVFLGGGLGSLCRWGVGLLVQPWTSRFPWATLLANMLACLIMGYLMAKFMHSGLAQSGKLFWMVGFCGGFSTFSSFTAETFQLWQSGQNNVALANILLNFLVCMAALPAGMKLAG